MRPFMLVSKDKSAKPVAWNFYETPEAAEAARMLIPADPFYGGPDDYEVLPSKAFYARQAAHYLGQEMQEITEERYQEMLGVLPPLRWELRDGVERFCICEFLEGSYTWQYARHAGRYFGKIVDYSDRSTMISAAMVEAFDARQKP